MPIAPAADHAALARVFAGAEPLLRMGAFECDVATDRLVWTPGVYDLFDMPRGAPLDRRRIIELYEEPSRSSIESLRAAALSTGEGFTLDAEIVTAAGDKRWIRLSAAVAREPGRPVRLYGGKQDVTRERLLWDQLRLQAERDGLTGLANRDLFERRLRSALETSDLAALLLVDVDRFKQINDRFGHVAGDLVLGETAGRLARAFADPLVVARIGGDEFAVLLRAPLDRALVERAVRRVVRDLARPVAWNGRLVAVGASVGVAIARPGRPTRDGLFAEADAALYAAKSAGRGTYRMGRTLEAAAAGCDASSRARVAS